MLRAELSWLANGPTLKMEGELVSEWATKARYLVTKRIIPSGLIVDLTQLTYVDAIGEDLLKWLASVDARFVAESSYAEGICEELRLPLLKPRRCLCSKQAQVALQG